MTTYRSTARRAGAALLLAGALAIAGCGASGAGTAAPSAQAPTPQPATSTPAPTATPEPTPSPTAAMTAAPTDARTEAPASAATVDLGGFAFRPGEVLDYYVEQGFICEDPQASNVAAGYASVRCLKTEDSGATAIVSLVVDEETGITGDAFAGYVTAAGTEGPDRKAAAMHLGGFVAAMLGTELGAEAATWVATNIDAVDLESSFGGIAAIIYQENDEGGVGHYVEVANDTYLNAPAP
ncbi:MAG TPA: hypothetical protein VES19_09620 [Candidatus Limnocylindrales bacterium]|nr:hypothetical protein [Candidatus Limnocylindrales bacterium]